MKKHTVKYQVPAMSESEIKRLADTIGKTELTPKESDRFIRVLSKPN